MDEVRQLGHALSLAFAARAVQTAGMPLPAIVAVSIAVAGSAVFLTNTIRDLRRRKRNLEHYEKGEPLEGGADDWD
jgi:hypothetical protein